MQWKSKAKEQVRKRKKKNEKPDIPYCGRARAISGFRHPHQKRVAARPTVLAPPDFVTMKLPLKIPNKTKKRPKRKAKIKKLSNLLN